MPEQLYIYEVEDPDTGDIYEMEAGPDAKPEDFMASIQAYKTPATDEGVAPQGEIPQAAAPSGVQQAQTPQGRDPTAIEANLGRDIGTVGTLAERNRDDITSAYEGLWAKGVRDPKAFNELAKTQFGADNLPELSGADIVQLQKRDAWYKARNMKSPGMFTAPEATGVEDAVKPDDAFSGFASGAERGLQNMGNAAVGLAGLGASAVGADDTAMSLMQTFMDNEAKIALNNPSAVPTVQEIESWGDFGMFVGETLGELLPNITSSMAAGGLGAGAAKAIATRGAVKFVEAEVAKGVPREVAQAAAIANIQKQALKGAMGGTAAFSMGQESGSTMGKTYGATGEMAPWMSLAAGTISGSLDAVLPGIIMSKIAKSSVPKAFETAVFKKLTKEGFKGMALEGGTEALQEFVTSLPTAVINGESPLSAEMLDQMVNAFAKGVIGGGSANAITTAATINRNGVREPVVNQPLEQTIDVPTGGTKTKKYKAALSQATEQVAGRINNLTEGWREGPSFVVHDNFDSLKGVENDAIGVFQEDGTVAINTQAVIKEARLRKTTPDAIVAAVTYHEALGHYGLAKEFGTGLDQLMSDFYDNSDSVFKAKVDTWLKKNPKAYEGRSFREELATEEVLAEMSEKGQLPVAFKDKILNLIKGTARKAGIEWKYSDREITAILGMAHSAVINGKGRDVSSNGFSLAGNKYMQAGEKAETANLDTRAEAEMAIAQGADPEQVRQDTGWHYVEGDKSWRFELDDSAAKEVTTETVIQNMRNLGEEIPESAEAFLRNNDVLDALADPDFLEEADLNSFTLENIIDHPALFEAYPEIRELAVNRAQALIDPKGKSSGMFMGESDDSPAYIYIKPGISKDEAKSTLLHEIQHWVQDYEGHAAGGNTSSALRAMSDESMMANLPNFERSLKRDAEQLEEQAKVFADFINDPDVVAIREPLFGYYYAKEALAAAEGRRLRSGEEDPVPFLQDRLSKNLDDYSMARKAFLKKHGIVNDKLTAKQSSDWQKLFGEVVSVTPAEARENVREMARKGKEAKLSLGRIAEGRKNNDPWLIRHELKNDKLASYEVYSHLFGEVEARDTEDRMDYTAEERKMIPPYQSEPDLDSDSYIYTDAQGKALSASKKSGESVRGGRFAANDAEVVFEYQKNGRPKYPDEILGSKDKARFYDELAAYYKKRAGKYLGNNQKIHENALKSMEDARENARKARADSLSSPRDRESRSARRGVSKTVADTGSTGIRTPANDKYMRPSSLDDIAEVAREELNSDELFESMNAYDILDRMTAAYAPEPMAMDTIKAEAELRGFTAQNFLRTNPKQAGDLSRRLVMYDIAAEKLNEKITKLYAKIQSGQADPDTAAEYAKTLVRFEELTSRMFGEQSEIGRALRTIQELNYTRKRVGKLKDILGGVSEKELTEILSDPETLAKFAMQIQGQIEESAARLKGSKFKSVATNLLNVPRALMSSMDLSAPLRQGIFFVGRKEFYSSFIKMFKYWGSDAAYRSMMFDITQHPNYGKMAAANLAFSNANGSLSQKEEDFMTNYADWVPGVKRSERAYTGFLTKLRVDTFNSMLQNFEDAGIDVNDPATLKGLARFINSATGRGDLGKWNAAAPQLNSIFFSPRLIASRVNMLNPKFYYDLPAPVRKEALKSLLSFGAIAATVIGLSAAAGADIEKDPRSTDFGKVRVGNTRYDVLGGFGQYLTLGARLWTKQKMTGSGAVRELNSDEYRAENRGDVLIKFATNKFAPVSSYLWGYLTGQNAVGEDFVPQDEAIQRMTPMFLGDLAEIMEEHGVVKGAIRGAPGFFGVGVQNYASYALDYEKPLKAPETFERSNLEDEEATDVSIKDGVVTLKEATRNEWTDLLNAYMQGWMEEETAKPEWEGYSDAEKADIIADVRKESQKAAREDMLEQLGIE